ASWRWPPDTPPHSLSIVHFSRKPWVDSHVARGGFVSPDYSAPIPAAACGASQVNGSSRFVPLEPGRAAETDCSEENLLAEVSTRLAATRWVHARAVAPDSTR